METQNTQNPENNTPEPSWQDNSTHATPSKPRGDKQLSGMLPIIIAGTVVILGVVLGVVWAINYGSRSADVPTEKSFYEYEHTVPEGWELFESEFQGVEYAYAHPPDWEQSNSTYYAPDDSFTDSAFNSPDYEETMGDGVFTVVDGGKITVSLAKDSTSTDGLLRDIKSKPGLLDGKPEVIEIDGRPAVSFVARINQKKTISVPGENFVARFEYLQPYEENDKGASHPDKYIEEFRSIISSFHFKE